MDEFSPDLKTIFNEMSKLRKAFVNLKIEHSALFKQSEKQKVQLEKSKNRCQKLMDLFTAKYKIMMENSSCLNSELKYLRQVTEDLQSQLTSQTTELQNKENLFANLEEEMEILRSRFDLQTDEHKKNIETILDRNRIEKNREISQYQEKLDLANAEILKLKERLNYEIEAKNKTRRSSTNYHPALSDDCENDTPIKGKYSIKKRKSMDNRWPKLNITSTKAEETPLTPEQPIKRKKLFLLDNDTIVDLETP
ncbi:uncharacterized protein LOC127279490 [Leptopilina boulardi]|uniref:uncharacterized protein LOC127279490 n=1 Tax=Leptopilina boulardi TaxID=63433 RepID=UPI0021F59970|nr:uncharacterized protein LOC127279490 [Leptopilina boulardi]